MTLVFYKSLYCIHVQSLVSLLSSGEICHTEPSVGILSTEPFLVSVYYCTNHGLIKCTRVCGITRYHCSTCPSSIPNCNHLEVFKEWEAENYILEPEQASMDEASKFPSISQHRIPYPLPEHLRRLHDVYEAGEQSLPNVLVPGYNPDQRCKHGNVFSSEDPFFSGWVASSEVIVYKYSVIITSATRKLYCRPAQGGCNCRSFYDEQDDILFNKHLFIYGLLFQYLHLMIEGKNPLAALHRSTGWCHGVLGTTQPPTTLKILRSAWNAFTRLLDLKFSGNFQCPVCGRSPETIMMALWWDLEKIFSQLSFKNLTENFPLL